jgi:exonuclease III
MKVVTYNFCKGGPNFHALHKVLAELQPDILFAQELRDPQRYVAETKVSLRTLGYQNPIWCPVPDNSERWGSAIFTKRDVLTPIDIQGPLRGWVVGGECDLLQLFDQQPGPLKLFSVHTPTRDDGNHICQLQLALEYIAEYIATHESDASLLVAGDFNVTISSREPSDDARTTSLEQEISTYFRRTLGLINCWQTIHPSAPLSPTYHSYLSKTHIDGIFISAQWCKYLKTSSIVGENHWTIGGDHYPVIADFDSEKPEFRKTRVRTEDPSACAAVGTAEPEG